MSVEQQLGATKDSNTIFVSNLPPTVSEASLYELLSTANSSLQITSLHLIKKNSDHPYAYANFATPEQAVEALQTCNFLKLNECEVVLTKNAKPNTLAPGSNLYVGGFTQDAADLSYKTLFAAFSLYGSVISVRFRKTGPKACCYVQYETLADAQDALIKINNEGLKVNDEVLKLNVDVFKSRANRERLFTNVFVRNFPANFPEDQFKSLCEKFGPVSSVWIPQAFPNKPGTDLPSKTGYGFANFKSHEDALKAIEGLKQESIGEFVLAAFEARDRVSRARDVQERSQSYNNSGSRHNGQNNNGFRQRRFASSVKIFPPQGITIQEIASMVQNTSNIFISRYGFAKIDFFDAQSAAMGRSAFPREWSPQFTSTRPQQQQRLRHHQNNFHQPHYQQHFMQQQPQYYHHSLQQQQHHQQQQQHHQQQHPQHRMNSRRHMQRSRELPLEQSSVPEGDDRQALGSSLYYAVQPLCINDEMTSKVTGMLLELPTMDVRSMLTDEASLRSRINDALALLNNTPTQ